jgi:hypothetical protein
MVFNLIKKSFRHKTTPRTGAASLQVVTWRHAADPKGKQLGLHNFNICFKNISSFVSIYVAF